MCLCEELERDWPVALLLDVLQLFFLEGEFRDASVGVSNVFPGFSEADVEVVCEGCREESVVG